MMDGGWPWLLHMKYKEFKTGRTRFGFQLGEKVLAGPNRSQELPEGKASESEPEGTRGPVLTSGLQSTGQGQGSNTFSVRS